MSQQRGRRGPLFVKGADLEEEPGCVPDFPPTAVDRIRPLPPALVRKMFGKELAEDPEYLWGSLGTIGDGSCMFHSLAAALAYFMKGQTKPYMEMTPSERSAAVAEWRCSMRDSYTREHHDRLAAKLVTGRDSPTPHAKVHKDFCDASAWANEIMIRHIMHHLKLNIVFVNCQTRALYCGVHGEAGRTILIAWVRREHFELIVRVRRTPSMKKGDRVEFNGILQPHGPDAKWIRAIMNSHEMQCADGVPSS